MRYCIVFLFFYLSISVTFAQEDYLPFEHLDSRNGLEGKFNDFIFKDSRGYIWISSIEGLHQYDGEKMKRYSPNGEFGSNMRGKNIQSRCSEDNSGNIWFSTNEAIHCYHWKEDSMSIHYLFNSNKELLDKDYNAFYLENDTILWTLADETIYQYNIITNQSKPVLKTKGVRFGVETTKSGNVSRIYACPWIKSSGFEIINFYEDGNYNKSIVNYIDSQNDKSNFEVYNALVHSDSCAWLFTDMGLMNYNPILSNIKEIYALPNESKTIINDGVILSENHLIISAKNKGIWQFNIKEKLFEKNYISDKNDLRSIGSNNLRELFYDEEEMLWLAQKNSAEIDLTWIHSNHFANPLSEVSANIISIVEDKEGFIWCLSKNNGLFQLDSEGNLINQNNTFKRNSSNLNLNHLKLDKQKHLWAISKNALYFYDSKLKIWIKKLASTSLRLNDVSFVSDTLGVIASSEGMYKFNPLNMNIDSLNRKVGLLKSANLQVYNLFDGSDAYLYLPVKSSELWVYNCLNESVEILELGTEVHGIFEDENDSIVWLGTLDGLYYFNRNSIQKGATKIDLLGRDSQILGLLKDQENKLWLSTNNGLVCYKIDDKSFSYYQTQSEINLELGHFNLFSNCSSQNKKMWFGSNNGLVSFNPQEIKPYPFGPKLDIKSIHVNQEELNELNNIDKLDLAYYQNNINIEMSILSFFKNKLCQIRYKLDGFKDDWNFIDQGEDIIINNLAPGQYLLRIVGINANGISSPQKTILLNIDSPIWKKTWFIISILVFPFLLIIAIMRFNYRKQLRLQEENFQRKQKLDLALQSERNRIANDMHDDLGGGLTSIQIWLKKIDLIKFPDLATENLERAKSKAGELVENMREIIWAMDSSFDNINDLIAHIRTYSLSFFYGHGISCQANIIETLPDIKLGGTKRRNIFLCVKESIHNILKHAEASEVELYFECKESLIITISDNGKGTEASDKIGAGMGMNSMKQRMNEIGGTVLVENFNGTRITFKVPLY